MRRIPKLLAALLITAAISLSAFAVGGELSIPAVSAGEGDTVCLNMFLDETVTGDSMYVAFEYDTELLELIPTACGWGAKGVLKDFGSYGDSGVWAASSPQKIQNPVCTLAFRIREGKGFSKTQVKCTLTVKNGTNTLGTFDATGEITAQCDHSYGQWKDVGPTGHTRICTLCGGSQLQSHEWGEAKREPDPEDEKYELVKRSCALCGAERSERVEVTQESESDIPMATEGSWTPPEHPTAPEETHTHTPTNTEPAWPTEPRPTEPPYTDPPHTEPERPRATEPPRDHDHDHDRPDGQQSQNAQNGQQNQGQQNQGSQNGQQNQGSGDRPDSTEPTENGEEFHVHVGEDGQYIIHQGPEHQDESHQPGVAPTISPEMREELDQLIEQQEEAEKAKRREGGIALAIGAAALTAGAWWLLKRRRK